MVLAASPSIITVTAPGFLTSKKSVTLLVGSDQTVDFALAVGQLVQSVSVDATVTAIKVSISYHSSNGQARAVQLGPEGVIPTILPEPETSIDSLGGGWLGSKGLTERYEVKL
jgi:hypothetical protein